MQTCDSNVLFIEGYYTLVAMGIWCDVSCLITVAIGMYKKKLVWWISIAFVAHFVYIIFFFVNCVMAPWGRILGLALNVVAIALSSIPIPLEMDYEFETRTRANTVTELTSSGDSNGTSLPHFPSLNNSAKST